MSDILVIMGSARSDGQTKEAVDAVLNNLDGQDVTLVNLNEKTISYYDYDHANQDDDFLDIATKMTQARVIIFATPVYWYNMSAVMKTFFDRFSDLITIRKDLGRALKDRHCYVISTGGAKALPVSFHVPFEETCKYFEMHYHAIFYYYPGQKDDTTLAAGVSDFAMQIQHTIDSLE